MCSQQYPTTNIRNGTAAMPDTYTSAGATQMQGGPLGGRRGCFPSPHLNQLYAQYGVEQTRGSGGDAW